jgi:very-short-patch-repair endonuclease
MVEVDGSEFHSGHAAFLADRERDAWHAAIGFRVVRLTYAQVVHRWHEVHDLLRLLHRRGEHLDRAGIRILPRRAAE